MFNLSYEGGVLASTVWSGDSVGQVSKHYGMSPFRNTFQMQRITDDWGKAYIGAAKTSGIGKNDACYFLLVH
jgi:hypothetical protein